MELSLLFPRHEIRIQMRVPRFRSRLREIFISHAKFRQRNVRLDYQRGRNYDLTRVVHARKSIRIWTLCSPYGFLNCKLRRDSTTPTTRWIRSAPKAASRESPTPARRAPSSGSRCTATSRPSGIALERFSRPPPSRWVRTAGYKNPVSWLLGSHLALYMTRRT